MRKLSTVLLLCFMAAIFLFHSGCLGARIRTDASNLASVPLGVTTLKPGAPYYIYSPAWNLYLGVQSDSTWIEGYPMGLNGTNYVWTYRVDVNGSEYLEIYSADTAENMWMCVTSAAADTVSLEGSPGAWEKLNITNPKGDANFCIFGTANLMYVCLYQSGSYFYLQRESTCGAWETFQFIPVQ